MILRRFNYKFRRERTRQRREEGKREGERERDPPRHPFRPPLALARDRPRVEGSDDAAGNSLGKASWKIPARFYHKKRASAAAKEKEGAKDAESDREKEGEKEDERERKRENARVEASNGVHTSESRTR